MFNQVYIDKIEKDNNDKPSNMAGFLFFYLEERSVHGLIVIFLQLQAVSRQNADGFFYAFLPL